MKSFGTWLRSFKDEESSWGDVSRDFIISCRDRNEQPSIYKVPEQVLATIPDSYGYREARSLISIMGHIWSSENNAQTAK